ncbi:hypothetical protein PG994_010301 [Apiospora phragmitis]|uniref:Aminoglycoside phosphotransferase domain-containing protein n=1 Tax=Apiospora phragmitis TaxID=2905665 RepID=A0ABR1TPJ6_9PEZI
MAPLTVVEERVLAQRLQDQLAPTPYAVSNLTKLSGGTANFLYRGTLLQPSVAEPAATLPRRSW